MSRISPIDPAEFVGRVQPLLVTKDLSGLMSLLKSRWTKEQLNDLLAAGPHDARKVAMLALSLVGGNCCIPLLAEHLKDPDACCNQMAEHALWSIWFRGGSPAANDLLARGAEAIEETEFTQAERLFTEAIELEPNFAEAYNQRAVARYLTERFEDSITDCREVVRRMPCHFGAWAGMGHCHAHLGQIPDAIRSYVKALDLNPHLDGVPETLRELRQQWRDKSDS